MIERRRIWFAFAAISCMHTAHAHAHEDALSPTALVRTWTWDPWLLLVCFLSTAGYALGQRRLQRRRVASHRGGRQAASFVLAWSCLALALLSPLDFVSDLLFSAHMLQHELLMLVAAPLLVYARPVERYLWAMPAHPRQEALRIWSLPACLRWRRWVTAPAFALAIHALARWIWHVPTLFEAALARPWVHALQHAMFFFTALLFWWCVMQGRYGRLGYGVSVVFVFATVLHGSALGALITMADTVWYPSYATIAARLSLDALADQQLAGLIMWIGAGTLCTLLGVAIAALWLLALEKRTRLRERTAVRERPV